MRRGSGKNSVSGELVRQKQLRISVLRKHKKHVLNTYAFPSTMVMRGSRVPLPFLRIHRRVHMFLWKHIPNVEILEHHVYRCGNASLTHTRLQSLLMSLCGNTYVFTRSGSVNLETHAHFLVFFSKQQETHVRSTPTFSHLLLNNRKRQDLKSCSVALCAITFQLQPC